MTRLREAPGILIATVLAVCAAGCRADPERALEPSDPGQVVEPSIPEQQPPAVRVAEPEYTIRTVDPRPDVAYPIREHEFGSPDVAPAAAHQWPAIPNDVTHVATGRARFGEQWSDFRLVVVGHCSPEHCFSRGRIEWVEGSIPGISTIGKVTEITELDSVLVVGSVQFRPMSETGPALFDIEVINSYSGQSGRITLSITGIGTYESTIAGDPLGPPKSERERE